MSEDSISDEASSRGTVFSLAKRFFGVTPIRLVIGLAVLGGILGVLVLLD